MKGDGLLRHSYEKDIIVNGNTSKYASKISYCNIIFSKCEQGECPLAWKYVNDNYPNKSHSKTKRCVGFLLNCLEIF